MAAQVTSGNLGLSLSFRSSRGEGVGYLGPDPGARTPLWVTLGNPCLSPSFHSAGWGGGGNPGEWHRGERGFTSVLFMA